MCLASFCHMECHQAVALLGVLVCYLWQMFGSGCRTHIAIVQSVLFNHHHVLLHHVAQSCQRRCNTPRAILGR